MSLRPIAVEFLYAGLQTSSDIYGLNSDVMALVKKHTILTQDIIDRLQRQLDGGKNIYVDDYTYADLMQRGIPKSLTQRQIEREIGYNDVKDATAVMITDILSTGKIDLGHTDEAVERITEKVKKVDSALIMQCINGVRDADEYLFTHCSNVAFLNGLIAKWLGRPDEEIALLTAIGLLHDIGKLQVPTEILNKPGALNLEELEVMKMHPFFGKELLEASGLYAKEILEGVYQHHEKINGTGYPKGIRGDEISIYAKITSISDVYDAMIAKRVYKQEQSPFVVLDTFSKGKASELDYEIVNLFLDKMPKELVDKKALLSNGAIGKIVFVDKNNYAEPIVNVDGEVIQTGKGRPTKVIRMIV